MVVIITYNTNYNMFYKVVKLVSKSTKIPSLIKCLRLIKIKPNHLFIIHVHSCQRDVTVRPENKQGLKC